MSWLTRRPSQVVPFVMLWLLAVPASFLMILGLLGVGR
jgi:hypothetical protein